MKEWYKLRTKVDIADDGRLGFRGQYDPEIKRKAFHCIQYLKFGASKS